MSDQLKPPNIKAALWDIPKYARGKWIHVQSQQLLFGFIWDIEDQFLSSLGRSTPPSL